MTDLAALQRRFMERLFADGAADPDPRFAIYRRGAMANLQAALAAAYPVVRRLVGEAFFGEAAARFARAEPSGSGDLSAYGSAFASFLAQYPHARGLGFLPDVARLEWALHECSLAADGRRLDFAALAALDPERRGDVRLALHPAARLVHSAHPVLAIWDANQPGRDAIPARAAGPDRVLVHRDGLQARAALLDGAEWTVAGAIASGATLAQALDALDQAAQRRFAPALRRLAALGAFDAFEVAG
jgi:hypothetical protein